jgi:hypothetical protein
MSNFLHVEIRAVGPSSINSVYRNKSTDDTSTPNTSTDDISTTINRRYIGGRFIVGQYIEVVPIN